MSDMIAAVISAPGPYISLGYYIRIMDCCKGSSVSVRNPLCVSNGELQIACNVDDIQSFNNLQACVKEVADFSKIYPTVVAVKADTACANMHNQNPRSFSCGNSELCSEYATVLTPISFSIPANTLDISTALPFSASITSTAPPVSTTISVVPVDFPLESTAATTTTASSEPVSATFSATTSSTETSAVSTTSAAPASSPTPTVSSQTTATSQAASSSQSSATASRTSTTSSSSSSGYSYQKARSGSKLVAYAYIWSFALAVALTL